MGSLILWLYLNLRYRAGRLPQDPAHLEKLALDLRIPLAFTYRANGLDMTLAQQRIHNSLNSFRWLAPLAIAGLFFALLVTAIYLHLTFPGRDKQRINAAGERSSTPFTQHPLKDR